MELNSSTITAPLWSLAIAAGTIHATRVCTAVSGPAMVLLAAAASASVCTRAVRKTESIEQARLNYIASLYNHHASRPSDPEEPDSSG